MTPTPTAPAATALSAEQISKATPRPWSVCVTDETVIFGPDKRPVATASFRDVWDEEISNAALIVAAVNAYDPAALAPQPAGGVGDDWRLPCDVRLPPRTLIKRGVNLHTLLVALQQREKWAAQGDDLSFADAFGPSETLATPRPSRQGGEDEKRAADKAEERYGSVLTVDKMRGSAFQAGAKWQREQAPRPAAPADAEPVAWFYEFELTDEGGLLTGEWRSAVVTGSRPADLKTRRNIRPLVYGDAAPPAEAGRVAELEVAARAYMEAAEAVFDWLNGNDLVADHAEQCPEDYDRINAATERLRAALRSDAP